MKHLPVSASTEKGHLKQERQGLQSTKDTDPTIIDDDFYPPSPSPNIKTHDVIYSLIESSPTGLGYMDLTGRFPYRSSQGNEYILVGYHYDANAILAIPIKNRNASTITEAWKSLHNDFKQAGVPPNTYVLDNEISSTLKDVLVSNKYPLYINEYELLTHTS